MTYYYCHTCKSIYGCTYPPGTKHTICRECNHLCSMKNKRWWIEGFVFKEDNHDENCIECNNKIGMDLGN